MAFIIKHSQDVKPHKEFVASGKKENNKKVKKEEKVMDKISMAENIINDAPAREVKKLKKDKGLIERTESSKMIITEDNKQLLVD